jgi:hypothetical protein
MLEFGVENFESIAQHEGMKKFVGAKPALIFLGDLWSTDPSYERIRNFFIGEPDLSVPSSITIIYASSRYF